MDQGWEGCRGEGSIERVGIFREEGKARNGSLELAKHTEGMEVGQWGPALRLTNNCFTFGLV